MNNTTKTIIFQVPIPGAEPGEVLYRVPVEIPVEIDAAGDEIMTEEGSGIIHRTQARHMGLLLPEEIKELRTRRLKKTQFEMAELLGCGEKSYTRWENGHSRPSQMVNTLLRLLWESRITLQDLHAVRTRRLESEGEMENTNSFSVSLPSESFNKSDSEAYRFSIKRFKGQNKQTVSITPDMSPDEKCLWRSHNHRMGEITYA